MKRTSKVMEDLDVFVAIPLFVFKNFHFLSLRMACATSDKSFQPLQQGSQGLWLKTKG